MTVLPNLTLSLTLTRSNCGLFQGLKRDYHGIFSGIRNTANNMLKWCRALIKAYNDQQKTIGYNPCFVNSMPIAGHRSDELLIYHQGSTTGYKSSVYLIPDAERATVVLSNSISLSDCTGWVDQLTLEALLDVDEHNDCQKC